MKKRVKINGLIIFFACLLIVSFPTVFFRNHKPTSFFSFDTVAEVFGITFILLGQIFRVSSRGFKAEQSGDGHSLIQAGPYALVRNPMYLGILLVGAGIVLILFNWWMIGIFLSVFLMRYLLLIFKEEKKLQTMFVGDYLAYQQKVPRILPSWYCLRKEDICAYLPLKLSWLRKEISSILAVLFTVLFLKSWEDIKNKGIAVYFKEAVSVIAIILLFIAFVIYLSKRTVSLEKNVSNKSKSTL